MYMSPEQLRGEDVDGRSDLYSLGAVLYELMTGKLAFEADSDYELMMKQLNEPPPPVRATLSDVPPAVDQVLQRTMAKQREGRYMSAAAMRAALQATLAGAVAPPPPRATPPTRLADTPAPPRMDREVPLSGVAITADHPAPSSAPMPATRLATPAAPVAPTRFSHESAASGHLQQWTADWRVWSGAAAVLLLATLAIRTIGAPDPVAPADSTVVAPIKPEVRADPEIPPRGPVAETSATGSGAGTQGPVAARATTAITPGPLTPGAVAPVAGQPGATRPERQRSAARDSSPVEQTVTPVRSETVAPAQPPRTDPDPPPTRDSDNREAAEEAVAAAVEGFASAVNGGSADRVGSMLRGGADEAQFVQLVREGRLKLDITGRPDTDLNGARATARFSANLNVRSAFGGNKRSSASFVAELAGSGDSWRVTSVRPLGKLDLK
jgi:serine/threonine-protein kinase